MVIFSYVCIQLHCVRSNCELIVNHLLVDFNRISHTLVSPCIFIQNGFKEIKCDYTVDLKNVRTAQYCVSNMIHILFFFARVCSVYCSLHYVYCARV